MTNTHPSGRLLARLTVPSAAGFDWFSSSCPRLDAPVGVQFRPPSDTLQLHASECGVEFHLLRRADPPVHDGQIERLVELSTVGPLDVFQQLR